MNNFSPTDLVSQVTSDYLSYSVASLSRGLPDIFDGMVPSRRRILQTMIEEGLLPGKPYVKCARTTGLTSAFYHPHGSAYSSLINMATPWNNMIPWIDCHGNVGSTVDPPAAERYVENRLTTSAVELLLQNRETWETRDNYDGSRKEAIRLNTKIPAVLLNGIEGISCGYSTKLPQHNLSEICDAIIQDYPLNPDFSTGCSIISDTGLAQYRLTGAGPIRCRAKMTTEVIEKNGRAKERTALTFTNLPLNTNPEQIGQQIKEGLEKGKIEGITEVIDLSDLSGDRIQVVTKPGVEATTVAKHLYAYTSLESVYSARNMVLDGVRPTELPTSEIIKKWKAWRLERLRAQFEYEREAKESRLEIVSGLLKAIDKLDAVIKVIRASASPQAALIELVSNRALKALISSEPARSKYMLSEIKAISKKFGEPRRSSLIDIPESFASQSVSQRNTTPSIPKPRYIKVDTEKGTLTKALGPRGALVLQSSDKLITLTADGTLKLLPSNYTGTLSSSYSRVLLAKPESDVTTRKYLLVFTYNGALKAMTIAGEHLAKVTSKGKAILPEGTTILHFSEKPYTVHFVSNRKKPLTLDRTTQPGKPGGLGIKIGALLDIQTTEPSFA
jgi:DNA gyrase subunit A